jgi:endonuclease G, mitochondrial
METLSKNGLINFKSDVLIDFRLEQVVGTNDFQHPWFLRAGWDRSRCVGVIPNMGTCFLIAENVVMTNWHIFRRSEWAAGKLVVFEYEQGADGLTQNTTKCEVRPDELFYSYEPLDFAIVRVLGNPGKTRGFFDIRQEGNIALDTRVNIIQHPSAELKKIAIRNNGLKSFDEKRLQYWTDTEHGSSGSPLFNDSWDLIGLHYLSDEAPGSDGSKVLFNVGHRISAIWSHLTTQGINIY